MIRGVRAAKAAPSWQDLRAVYPQTAVCRAFRMHGAHILPKPAHFGCMARESCHELAIFPSEAAFGMHGAQNLPRIDARERTAAESCHGKTPGNAPRENIATASRAKSASGRNPATARCWGGALREHFAIVERLGTHRGEILSLPVARERISRRSCHGRTPGFAPHQITAALPAKKTAPKAGLGERPRQKHERQSAGAAGASSRYGAVQRHRRTLGNAARRNIAMADNAPRDIRRRAFCSPSFAFLFTARVAIGDFSVGSRRHLAVSLIEAHIR